MFVWFVCFGIKLQAASLLLNFGLYYILLLDSVFVSYLRSNCAFHCGNFSLFDYKYKEKERKMGGQKPRMLSLIFTKLKPYLAMITLQFGYAGMFIITLVSLKRGMSNFVLIVYRHAVATLVIAPFALVLERSSFNYYLFC